MSRFADRPHVRKPIEISRVPRTFFGEQVPFQKARAVILPVPYDAATSFRSGAREGPGAVFDASVSIEWYDLELGVNIADRVPLHTVDPPEMPVSGPERAVELVEHEVERILKARKFPATIGGDHSISSGCVRSIVRHFRDVTVLHLDAHGDLRDSYQDSPYSHASVMRRCHELTGKLVQVGIRNVDEEQRDFQHEQSIAVFPAPDVPIKKIIAACSKNVYVSLDVDVFDPGIMPATGTPLPGGLGWYQVTELLRTLGRERRIVGFDVVELAPIPGLAAPNVLVAQLVYKLIGYALLRR